MSNEYEVGFGKPPKFTQFKPGQSGNNKGRRKGSKNTYTLLNYILSQKICIKENGKDLKISKRMAMLTGATLLDEGKFDTEGPIKITKNIRISTTSRNGSVLIVNNAENKEIKINPFLVKIIAKGHYWNKLIDDGKVQTAKEIAEFEKEHNVDYVKKAIRLNILSPRIVENILSGNQPEDLTVEKLCSIKTLDWKEQEKLLCL